MINPTVMPTVTPKQKRRNISLHTTQDVVISVLMSYLLMPYGIGEIQEKPAKYGLIRPFYPYFRQFGRAGPESNMSIRRKKYMIYLYEVDLIPSFHKMYLILVVMCSPLDELSSG